MSEPTLRDLVLKLRTQPLASPEIVLPPPPSPELPAAVNDPQVSRLDLHEKKFPLGGAEPGEQPVAPVEKAKLPDDQKAPTRPEKKL
jgi:hypothetical protein